MPELPEVETVVRGLQKAVGYTIVGYSADPEFTQECLPLISRRIEGIRRRGKFIIFDLDQGAAVSHLRMTGKWFLGKEHRSAKHARICLTLDKGGWYSEQLVFVDPRKFGTFEFVAAVYKHPSIARLGIDGLEIGTEYLARHVADKAFRRDRPIKGFLLDQSVIAGCGNIYAAEALWCVGVDPRKTTRAVGHPQVRRICAELHRIFLEAIAEGGTSAVDYLGPDGNPGNYQTRLAVYGREGKPCPRCGASIERITQGGRSTFFCPECQK